MWHDSGQSTAISKGYFGVIGRALSKWMWPTGGGPGSLCVRPGKGASGRTRCWRNHPLMLRQVLRKMAEQPEVCE